MAAAKKSERRYLSQINCGFGWVTIAEFDDYPSAKSAAWDRGIERDCDHRVLVVEK